MNKGRIIFLNGVTSSGKTSIVEALQNREDCYFYVVANDLFEQMIGDRFLREDYWQHLAPVILLMYRTAKLFSDQGYDVLIDGILVERPEIAPHYKQMMDTLAENPLSIVEVACPLEVCRERNIARGDRYENQSAEQLLCETKNDSLVELTLPKDANIYAQQYALCLPDKKLLKEKLREWIDEFNEMNNAIIS